MTPTPTQFRRRGRPSKESAAADNRQNHYYGHPTVGPIQVAVFIQRASGQQRTVEIVRYIFAHVWKARIRETQSVLTRGGAQCEFQNPHTARSETTQYCTELLGLEVLRPWHELPAEERIQ